MTLSRSPAGGSPDSARPVRFQDLAMELATALSGAPFEAIDAAIQATLEKLGRFTGVDRSYVFLLHEDDPSRCSNTHEWCAEGITPQIDNLQDLPVEMTPEPFAALQRGEVWNCPDVAALPPEQAATRQTLEAQEIRSLVLVPLQVEGTLIGFIGFDWVRRREPETAALEPLLRVAGGLVAQAVSRYRQQRRLLDQQRRLQELVQAQYRYERTVRRQLAAALHDGVGQELAAAKLELQLAAREGHRIAPTRLERLVATLDRCLARTRDITFEIYPSSLHRSGLLAALRELAVRLAGAPDFRLVLELPGQEPDLPEELCAELFMAARELVHNARVHSGAEEAVLRVSPGEDSVRLTVSDRGRGFDPAVLDGETGFRHGFGLANIRERTAERGGRVEIVSRPGAGTTVTIACPVPPAREGSS